MTKTKMRAKIFAALLGLSMVVPTLFTTTVKATEMEGVTVSDNEIEVTVCTDKVEADETQLDTEATCKRQVLSNKFWQLISATFWQIKSSTFIYTPRIAPWVYFLCLPKR